MRYLNTTTLRQETESNSGNIIDSDNRVSNWFKPCPDGYTREWINDICTFVIIPLPTQAELAAGTLVQAAAQLQELREKRNALLAETDWMANKDVTLPAAWKTYRQELRDLPSGLDTVEKVNAVTWPTKPS